MSDGERSAAGDAVAAVVRRQYRTRIAQLRAGYGFPLDAERLAQKHGLHIVERQFPPGLLGTLLHVDGQWWVIAVREGLTVPERRWTIAHEFAHWDLHHDFDQRCDAKNDWVWEVEANTYTAELLAPEEEVAASIRGTAYESRIGQLVRQFGISASAARWRLVELGLLPSPGPTFTPTTET